MRERIALGTEVTPARWHSEPDAAEGTKYLLRILQANEMDLCL